MISLLGVNVQHQRSRHEVRNTIRLAVVDVLATLPWSESSMPLLMVGVPGAVGLRVSPVGGVLLRSSGRRGGRDDGGDGAARRAGRAPGPG